MLEIIITSGRLIDNWLMFCAWRTAIAVTDFILAPQLLDNKRKKYYRYGIDGVVVDGLGRAGGLDRGEQGPLSFNYDL